ncbi:MAG: hypothetical protein K9L62_10290 [Vallitaleaceae bacterium]|nr:hypothetical protein [Vallitaleaceae bacterium]
MIFLKIAEKGHYIEIPGMSPFRTPAKANISHISIQSVVSRLQAQGIEEFEIVSDTKGQEAVFTQKDFNIETKNPKKKKDNYEKRFNKLEALVNKLLIKESSDETPNQEQITNKLNSIEKLLKKQSTTKDIQTSEKFQKHDTEGIKKTKIKTKPVVEDFDNIFIPDINISGMKIQGGESRKSIKQDKQDIDDSADMLSRILESED